MKSMEKEEDEPLTKKGFRVVGSETDRVSTKSMTTDKKLSQRFALRQP
jgi:hypothetical protein